MEVKVEDLPLVDNRIKIEDHWYKTKQIELRRVQKSRNATSTDIDTENE